MADLPFRSVAVPFVLIAVEGLRRYGGPKTQLAVARAVGRRMPTLAAEQRHFLKRCVALADRALPGGSNCLRRTLAESILDPAAASSLVSFGFKRGGHPGSGHAWLGDTTPAERSYDFVVSM